LKSSPGKQPEEVILILTKFSFNFLLVCMAFIFTT
jgi:hypothetical protein